MTANSTQIALITPTGARQEAFILCARYVARQSCGDWRWIIIDDGPVETPVDAALSAFGINRACTYLRPTPLWSGQNTLRRNLLSALSHCSEEWIAFVEDDDWYHPGYLERLLSKAKQGYQIVGEAKALYYHLPSASFRDMGNRAHASLSQTLMHRSLLPCLVDILSQNEENIDVLLWRAAWDISSPFLFPKSTHAVGMKGLPGRPGIGIGHRPVMGWRKDTNLDQMAGLIGDDLALYAPYLPTSELAASGRFNF